MSDRRAGNLGYFSHDAAREFPDRVAMIDLCGAAPREVTYGELEQRLDNVPTGEGELHAGTRGEGEMQ